MWTFLPRKLFIPLCDFIYPPLCLVCERLLQADESRVCGICWAGIKQVDPGHPVWREIRSKFASGENVEEILSCYLFEKEGSLQQIIHSLKYQGMRSLGVALGRTIGRRIARDELFISADAVVPIPLHTLKQRERGYNQSVCLCEGIARETDLPVIEQLLKRERYTRSQTQLSMTERRENVDGAFQLNPRMQESVDGMTIILVDDVITTGATVDACAKVLLAHGARRVLAVSAALAE